MARSLHHCPAPAKLNLFLHVTGRRADGYHLLQTVFQLIDIGDTLHFTLRHDGHIQRTTVIDGIPENSDLIVRAARLLQAEIRKRTGKKPGADISIEKRLPAGGGLGGGSSDAATTLLALNHLWESGLSKEELMTLGLQLGADVPFFIFGHNAFAEGIGEKLTPIDIPDGWFVVINPNIVVPTSAIFASEELTRNTEKIKITDFPGPFTENGFWGKNDLQSVAMKLYPPVSKAIEWLDRYANARMTGSGACVFARFDNEEAADKVIHEMPEEWKGWKARGLKTHPLDGLFEASGGK
ncbi:MAG: 4-(cytidine 5'-diphospho)-2-C-methyl-D-erythritol kinase [Betaproteobacteria bacterium]|nr:4-(cytidine 5'-diphospho)-2-C-methyl-D-erythritol kinase [Betaproteobacteria bacterium]